MTKRPPPNPKSPPRKPTVMPIPKSRRKVATGSFRYAYMPRMFIVVTTRWIASMYAAVR